MQLKTSLSIAALLLAMSAPSAMAQVDANAAVGANTAVDANVNATAGGTTAGAGGTGGATVGATTGDTSAGAGGDASGGATAGTGDAGTGATGGTGAGGGATAGASTDNGSDAGTGTGSGGGDGDDSCLIPGSDMAFDIADIEAVESINVQVISGCDTDLLAETTAGAGDLQAAIDGDAELSAELTELSITTTDILAASFEDGVLTVYVAGPEQVGETDDEDESSDGTKSAQ